MQTLPQPGSSPSEARPVSEILAKANPAEMPAMRASLSFLTSAGAELATALARRNQEYDDLLAIVSTLPPEWVQAAKTGGPLPDFGSLRAELELAKDERIDLHGQLVERDRQIAALHERLGAVQAPPPPAAPIEPMVEEAPAEAAPISSAEIEQLNTQLEALRGELETAALARSQAEDDLRTSEAELGDFENRLVALRNELVGALPEDVQGQLPAAPAEDQVEDPRQRRAMRLGALAAAISSLVDRNRQDEEQLQAANAQVASIQEEFDVSSADRMAMEADLQEKVQTLEDQQTQIEKLQSHQENLTLQIEELTGQVTQLQAELDSTLAAKTQAEEQLQLREGELAELNQQIDSVAQQLTDVLPEDVVAQLRGGEVEEIEAAPADDGDQGAEGDMTAQRAAPKMLGLSALAAGVAAAVDLSSKKSSEAADASGQLAALVDEKTGLEDALAGKEQALAELNSQIEALTAQGGDLQAQLDAAAALKADLEQQLGEREQHLAELNGQVDDAALQLRALLPEADLAALEAPAPAVEGDGEPVPAEVAARPAGLAALVAGVAGLLSRKDGSVAELSEQYETLQANYEDLGQERLGLEALLAEKSQQLAGYNDYVLNLQGQVNELAAEKSAVEADLQLRTQAQAEVEAQIDALNVQIGDLTAQVDALNAQIGEVQAQVDASNAAKAEMEQALEDAQAQLDAAQAELAQIDEESQRSLGGKAVGLGVVGAGAAAAAAIRNKDDELAAANEQIAALRLQVDDLTAGNADLAGLQAQLAELNEAKAALDAQLGERAAEIDAMAARVAELEVERGGITASKAEIEAGLEGKDAELADLRGQLEALQQQVASVTEERSVLQEQLVEVQDDLNEVEALRSAALSFGSAAALSDALANLPAIKKHAVTAAIVAGVQPTLSPRIQALTDVKGIGSAYQQRLYRAGVGTYWELASVPDAEMESALEIPELQRARIDFDETRADAYEWAKLTDTVGLLWDGDHVDDFESLPGIGKTFEKRLYEAGITTYEQLAECDVEQLAGIIKPPPMREVNYDQWKDAARQILAERSAEQPVG